MDVPGLRTNKKDNHTLWLWYKYNNSKTLKKNTKFVIDIYKIWISPVYKNKKSQI